MEGTLIIREPVREPIKIVTVLPMEEAADVEVGGSTNSIHGGGNNHANGGIIRGGNANGGMNCIAVIWPDQPYTEEENINGLANTMASYPYTLPGNHKTSDHNQLRPETPSDKKSFVDGSPSSSWFAVMSSGSDRVGKKKIKLAKESDQRNVAHFDDALAERITGNSGVSFCISKSSLQTSVSEQQNLNVVTPVINSAVVEPAPDQSAAATNDTVIKKQTTAHLGMVLTFLDVGYKLAKKRRHSKWGSGKQILQGITGSVLPGEILALMGPSGSGKTTLLNLLGARNQADDLNTVSGVILYDGGPYNKFLKPRMGFVTQDDMLYPHLTVKETLTYAALLRLPASMSRKEKTDKAEQVIRQLGLERCRDTVIGNAFLRGVSGGERKRVCIGHEILIDPSLIFLDEPTSGLDSTTALRIMQLLQNLAQTGRTVVTTVHQPSSRLFYLFDKLLLLAEGRCAYFGKADNAVPHFESIGFAPLVAMNPADFLLDLCSGNTNDMKAPTAMEQAGEQDGGSMRAAEVVQYLVECNAREVVGAKERAKLGALQLAAPPAAAENRVWAATWGTQVAILLERSLKERRHDYLGWLKVTQVMATGLLCGSLWWRSKATTPAELQDQVGLLFFIGLFWGFFPLFNAIFTFPLERALLTKERASDMYRLSAYFVARSVSDLPLDLLLPTCFVTLVYFMATLRMSVAAFCLTMLAIFLTVITSQGVGLLIGAVMRDVKKATTFGSVLVIAFMLAGGYFVQSMPKCVAWLKYLSFQSYCYKLLLKIQYFPFYNIHICSNKGATLVQCRRAMALNRALHGMRLTPGAQEVWSLLALTLVCRLLTYLALRQIKISSIGTKIKRYVCPIATKHYPKQDHWSQEPTFFNQNPSEVLEILQ